MTIITRLDDHQCEVLRGGFWGSFTSVSRVRIARSATTLTQGNNAENTGLGLLVGLGNAQSLQGNGADISTIVL